MPHNNAIPSAGNTPEESGAHAGMPAYATPFAKMAKSGVYFYTPAMMKRCFTAFFLGWLALQAIFTYSPHFLGPWVWFTIFICVAGAVLCCAAILAHDKVRFTAPLQGAGIIIVFTSLAQGAGLQLPSAGFSGVFPSLVVFPALYMAIKYNIQFFSLLGYACALCAPLYLGTLQTDPQLLFTCYLAMCLFLPFVTMRTEWKASVFFVFAWVFVVLAVFLCTGYHVDDYPEAQLFFIIFVLAGVITGMLRIGKASFDVRDFFDFSLCVALPAISICFQLRIVAWNHTLLLASAMTMTAIFAVMALLTERYCATRCGRLGGIYLGMSFCCFGICLHMLLPGTTVLAVFCAAATLLFARGSLKNQYRKKVAGAVILLVLAPVYFFISDAGMVAGAFLIASSAVTCAFLRDRESRRQGKRSGARSWSSVQELVLLVFGYVWFFSGLALFSFSGMPEQGLIFFALSSACSCFFFALGKLIRFRSMREVIFLPLFISIPAALLPVLYQSWQEGSALSHWFSYNYLSGTGGLAWLAYFVSLLASLYRNWGGLISNRRHAQFLGLVTLELILVLTSSFRAFAFENGVSPAILSLLAVLPSLVCVWVLSYAVKYRNIYRPYRRIMVQWIPGLLLTVLGAWFILSLRSIGGEGPGGMYVPLLYPVEFAQIACIFVFGYWQRRLRKAKLPTPHFSEGRMCWIYGVWGFLWLHGVMFRVVQYFSQALLSEAFNFSELRFIFGLIWGGFGIVVWILSTRLGSPFSWWCGLAVFVAGVVTAAWISLRIWNLPMAILMFLLGLLIMGLLEWRSPPPFTARGKKLRVR